MSSFGYGGSVRMNPEIKNEKFNTMFEEGYPFTMPIVHLVGSGEEYYPQLAFSWCDDSVVFSRNKQVIKYTRSSFVELLAKNEAGEIVWMDGRNAPYSSCWNGEYLNEDREAHEYTIEEYDLETKKKRKYKVSFEEETDFDSWDYRLMSRYVDPDKLDSHFIIEDGVLLQYMGNDSKLIIPNDVTEIRGNPFLGRKEFETIEIPSTLVKIPELIFSCCQAKEIIVAESNPKYYTKDGCLIDKETGTLVWGYAAIEIPRDDSIRKIGPNAFCYRDDLENIVIPDNITSIGNEAFIGCCNMKYVLMSDAVKEIGMQAFYNCVSLSQVRLSASLSRLETNTFAFCTSLESIDIPDSIKTIECDAFGGYSKLKEIGVSYSSTKIVEKALGVKLIRNGDKWLIEHLAPSVNWADGLPF